MQQLDREGRVLTVRDVMSTDLATVADLLAHLSPRSARQRFLSTSTRAGPEYVLALADPQRTLDAVLVEAGNRVVAVGSTHPLPDDTVEFAVVVDDANQGHGIGTLVMEELVARAGRRGVRTMVGTVLGANAQMFDVLGHLGVHHQAVVEGGTAAVTLTLAPDTGLTTAHTARSDGARAAAVRPVLEPAGIAVLLPRTDSRTRAVDWAGRPEVPVSVIARVDDGYDDGYDVPPGVELALVPDWLGDAGRAALACAEAGVPAIVLFGRDEADPMTAPGALDRELLDQVRAAGARVLGPGSRCVVNTDPLVRLHLGAGARLAGGSVAVVTDDPTCVGPLHGQLTSRGMGFSVVVDVGAAMDLGVPDVVAWLARDPRTELVVVALRGPVPDGLVAQLARVHEDGTPVLFLARGHRDLVGASEVQGAGPVRAVSVVDCADLAMVFVLRGQPPGRRVVVVTNEPWTVHAGANRRLARGALLGPDLTQHSEMRIHFLTPGTTARGGILALPLDASPGQVHDVLATLVDDPGVDAVIVDLAPNASLHRQGLWRLLRGLPRERSEGRPSPVVVAVDPHGARHHGTLPVFDTVTDALDALARTCPRHTV